MAKKILLYVTCPDQYAEKVRASFVKALKEQGVDEIVFFHDYAGSTDGLNGLLAVCKEELDSVERVVLVDSDRHQETISEVVGSAKVRAWGTAAPLNVPYNKCATRPYWERLQSSTDADARY